MNEQISLDVVTGKQKADPTKTWEGFLLKVGDYSHMFFAKTKFEADYIKSIIAGEEK